MNNKDNFTFDEATHTYRLNGKRMTGVTTVLGVIAKPALIQWAANQAVDYVAINAPIIEGLPHEILETTFGKDTNIEIVQFTTSEILEGARKAHIKKRDGAAKQGTDVHAVIESAIKDSIKFFGGRLRSTHSSDLPKQVQNFLDWAVKNNVKFLESEKQVYDADLFLAGTADLVCEIDGKRYIGDIKTTSGIYGLEPFMQCAAYAHMLEHDIDGTIIINLKKDGTFDEEKDVYFRYDLETDWKAFEHALNLYRLLATWTKPKNYANNSK